MFGSVTRRNVCQIEAPSVRDASSSSSPNSSSTGTTSRIVNGMQMKIVTSTIEGSAKRTWIPRAATKSVNQPPVPNSRTAASPTVTGESANGRSTTAFMSERPRNRCRTSTHATTSPKNVVTATVIDRDDPGEQEGVLHLGLRERVADDRDARLERLGDDPDQREQQEQRRRRRSRRPPARHGRDGSVAPAAPVAGA